MAFKLGSSRTPILKQGQVESPMYSKWDKDSDASVPGTPVLRKNLEGGIMGEANNDGTIFISDKLQPGSDMEKHVLMHEMVHQTDMKLGKLAYNDNCIKWNGEIHERKNGKIYYENEWAPEGSKHFPWEKMPWE